MPCCAIKKGKLRPMREMSYCHDRFTPPQVSGDLRAIVIFRRDDSSRDVKAGGGGLRSCSNFRRSPQLHTMIFLRRNNPCEIQFGVGTLGPNRRLLVDSATLAITG